MSKYKTTLEALRALNKAGREFVTAIIDSWKWERKYSKFLKEILKRR